MSLEVAFNRRLFLKSAGLAALAGAVAPGASLASATARRAGAAAETYDFDTVHDRVGTDSTRWDRQIARYPKDDIAVGMGVADMDFRTCPAVTRALAERIEHENWGYLTMPDSHHESMVEWNKRRYGLDIDPEWILNTTGVHQGLISALRAFAPRGSKVLVMSPIYSGFYTDIRVVDCVAEESPLRLVDGRYAVDFDELESRIDHDTHVLMLCNPQNPTGNVWSREDLLRLGEICTRRRVVVLSDEIHCDFMTSGHTYTPYQSLGDDEIVMNSITFKSASKSFSISAMKCAYMFTSNPAYRDRLNGVGQHRQVISTLGMVAHRAAYREGDEWLDQVLDYIDGNLDYAASFIARNVPLIELVKPEGTYLTWLDVSALADRIDAQGRADRANRELDEVESPVTPETMVERWLVEHAGIQMNPGASYGLGGSGRMRMNVATARPLVELALNNLAEATSNASAGR